MFQRSSRGRPLNATCCFQECIFSDEDRRTTGDRVGLVSRSGRSIKDLDKSQKSEGVEIAAHVRGQQAMYDFHARHGIGRANIKMAAVIYAGALPVRPMLRSLLANLVDRWWRDDSASGNSSKSRIVLSQRKIRPISKKNPDRLQAYRR
jgi:hypothetical protein